MARQKKSRKIGKIGVSKDERPAKVTSSGKPKNRSGKKPGSRQMLNMTSNQANNHTTKKDPRVGSKASVNLDKYKDAPFKKTKTKQVEKRYFSPQDELDAIENDHKLDVLLEKQQQSTLTSSEQTYLDTKLARHAQLCEMLGIASEEENETSDTDPFSSLDAISIDEFKN
ncbi:Der GTPase-activating protein YihI [Agaribacter flavus]|uniref:Der GTPase-activating protein YihI n=1 Tax=Agaribacter flavus TaxID=1902781 RepID=A0ABV7FT40_9ALTE